MRICRTLLLLISGASIAGCGIFAAPIAIPQAISENAILGFRGQVTDESGRPLGNVTMEMTKEHSVPSLNPFEMTSIINTEETHVLSDGGFNSATWDYQVTYTFSAPGYYSRSFKVSAHGLKELEGLTEFERPVEQPFNFELDRVAGHPLKPTMQILDERPTGEITYTDLEHIKERLYGLPVRYADTPPADPPEQKSPPPVTHALYIHTERDSDGRFAFVEVPPTKRSVLSLISFKSISLICTSPDGGIQRIQAQYGRPIGGRPRVAPEAGYQQEIVVTTEELVAISEFRLTIPFYIKAAGRYGRGIIYSTGYGPYQAAVNPGDPHDRLDRAQLSLTLYIQPDGSRNVD